MRISLGRCGEIIGLLAVALVSCGLIALSVFNDFYEAGDMRDGAWLSSVAWHSDFFLHGPPALPGSFFTEHVSPIFWLTNLASYALPLSRIELYALFLGVSYGLFAAGVYRLWQLSADFERDRFVKVICGVVIALAATFSGTGMDALRLPHHEMACPPLALWFFISLLQKRYRIASLWLLLCLMVREDVGFHIFGILFLVQAVGYLSKRDYAQKKMIWRFAFAAILYSVAVVALKNFAFSEIGGGVFQRSYIGSPPWAHVTAALIASRWHDYVLYKQHLYVPFAITCVWAVVARNWLLPIGYLAFVPWLLLSFFGTNDTSGTMAYYYGYPFWISLAWPLVALRLWPSEKGRNPWPYLLVVAASLLTWSWLGETLAPLDNHFFPDGPFAFSEGVQNRAKLDRFVDYYLAHEKTFLEQGLAADMAMSGLLEEHMDRDNWFLDDDGIIKERDVLLYFKGGYNDGMQITPLLEKGDYTYFYAVKGTNIRLASKRDLLLIFDAPRPFVKVDAP